MTVKLKEPPAGTAPAVGAIVSHPVSLPEVAVVNVSKLPGGEESAIDARDVCGVSTRTFSEASAGLEEYVGQRLALAGAAV